MAQIQGLKVDKELKELKVFKELKELHKEPKGLKVM
jgi:hypothetical protein